MANLELKLTSIKEHIESVLGDGFTYYLQYVPKQYKANVVTIEIDNVSATTETSSHYATNMACQIVVFADSNRACMEHAELLTNALKDTELVPLLKTNPKRYLRLNGISYSKAFETDTEGVSAVIIMAEVVERSNKNRDEYPYIKHISVRER